MVNMSTTEKSLDKGLALDSLGATAGDYFALLKPRVMFLVVFTALVGLMVDPASVTVVDGMLIILLIAIGAGASGALNMWYDADIDRLMSRTASRPIPSGKVGRTSALVFGTVLSVASVIALGVVSNWLAGGLLAFTIFFYAVIYSMWLKRSTPQNIVIGGIAGALPPIVAAAAATGTVTVASMILFAIIFVWTPPHFWALALYRKEDYQRAGIPMMPNVAGDETTRQQIVLYSAILAPLGLFPWAFGFAGIAYLIVAAVSGVFLIVLAWRIYREQANEEHKKPAQQMFAYSILYLFLLFTVLLIERMSALMVGSA